MRKKLTLTILLATAITPLLQADTCQQKHPEGQEAYDLLFEESKVKNRFFIEGVDPEKERYRHLYNPEEVINHYINHAMWIAEFIKAHKMRKAKKEKGKKKKNKALEKRKKREKVFLSKKELLKFNDHQIKITWILSEGINLDIVHRAARFRACKKAEEVMKKIKPKTVEKYLEVKTKYILLGDKSGIVNTVKRTNLDKKISNYEKQHEGILWTWAHKMLSQEKDYDLPSKLRSISWD